VLLAVFTFACFVVTVDGQPQTSFWYNGSPFVLGRRMDPYQTCTSACYSFGSTCVSITAPPIQDQIAVATGLNESTVPYGYYPSLNDMAPYVLRSYTDTSRTVIAGQSFYYLSSGSVSCSATWTCGGGCPTMDIVRICPCARAPSFLTRPQERHLPSLFLLF
jgi:hypothetical protein